MSIRLRPTAALVAVVAAALIGPAAAHAATVEVVPASGPAYSGLEYDQVRYAAAAGEANDLLVTFSLRDGSETEVRVRDTGAVVHAGAGCTQVDSHTAHCRHVRRDGITATKAWLGDQADKLHTYRGTPYPISGVTATGGPGDDLLDSGAGDDDLKGGGGRDTLLGGAGDDVVTDNDHSDAAGPQGPGPDVMDGGPGRDTVSYASRTNHVFVDLGTRRPTGERFEYDDVERFENASGGAGDDRLDGSDAGNTLRGGRGRDTLLGRGSGDPRYSGDFLYGGSGRDDLRGGRGPDSLIPGNGRDRRLSCGPGDDNVNDPEAGEVIGHCEGARFTGPSDDEMGDLVFPPRPVAFTRRSVEFAIGCPDDGDVSELHCAGRLKIRKAFGRHRLLGTGKVPGPDGSDDVVRVMLTRIGRRLFNRRGGVVATMRIRGRSLPTVAWTTELARR